MSEWTAKEPWTVDLQHSNAKGHPELEFIVNKDQPVCLFNASSYSLYHVIFEEIGQALFLKKDIPNLQIIAFYSKANGVSDLARSLLEPFNISLMSHPIEDYSKISIPKLFYYRYGNSPFLVKKLGETGSRLESAIVMHRRYTPYLREAFRKFRDKSRAPHNLKIYLKSLPKVPDLKYNPGDQRDYSPENIHKLEKFFKGRGYAILDPLSVSFREQVRIISRAKVLVSLSGSNSAHAIWLDSDATFFLMTLNSKYNFPHDDVIKNSCNLIYLTDDIDSLIHRLSTEYSGLL